MGADDWAEAWKNTGKTLGVEGWKMPRARSMSHVLVSGLTPGSVAVLEAPGIAFGKEVAAVEWKLLLPNAFRPNNYAYGPDIN